MAAPPHISSHFQEEFKMTVRGEKRDHKGWLQAGSTAALAEREGEIRESGKKNK